MWELEAFITTTMLGGELAGAWAGATWGGAAGIHGMATLGTPIAVIQVSTHIPDTTTDMTVTTDTVGMMRKGILKMVVGLTQLPDWVEIRTAD